MTELYARLQKIYLKDVRYRCSTYNQGIIELFDLKNLDRYLNIVCFIHVIVYRHLSTPELKQTRGPKGHISCTWVQCATFLTDWPGRPSCFSDQPKKHKLGRGGWHLSSCQVSLQAVQLFQRWSRKCLRQSEARAAILFFRSARRNKLGRGRWDLASCQVSSNPVQRFQRRSRKCLSQSEARVAFLFIRSAPKTQLCRGPSDRASCQVSSNSVQRFQRRNRKCLSQSEARAAILFFRSARKTQTW